MNRITILRNSRGELLVQPERLSKRPSGNAQQRNKALRNGWKPEWLKTGQPEEFDRAAIKLVQAGRVLFLLPGSLPVPVEIEEGRSIALWADGYLERVQEVSKRIRTMEEREFCRESGLL